MKKEADGWGLAENRGRWTRKKDKQTSGLLNPGGGKKGGICHYWKVFTLPARGGGKTIPAQGEQCVVRSQGRKGELPCPKGKPSSLVRRGSRGEKCRVDGREAKKKGKSLPWLQSWKSSALSRQKKKKKKTTSGMKKTTYGSPPKSLHSATRGNRAYCLYQEKRGEER